jgi:hypothetical protein
MPLIAVPNGFGTLLFVHKSAQPPHPPAVGPSALALAIDNGPAPPAPVQYLTGDIPPAAEPAADPIVPPAEG